MVGGGGDRIEARVGGSVLVCVGVCDVLCVGPKLPLTGDRGEPPCDRVQPAL